jgi:hypothetical protein
MKAHLLKEERPDASSDQEGGPIIYGTEQAAKFLNGIKPKTLDNWRHRGCGPAYIKIGARIGYLEKDLIAFLERRRFTSTSDYAARRAK